MNKKLAIIGASYLQLPLVMKAKEMNIETHCFAWPEGAVCREYADYFYPISVLDKDLILSKCQEIEIDGITTIATDIAVPTICFVAEKMKLRANSFNSAVVSTNKFNMRCAFKAFDCNTPDFIETSTYDIDLAELKFPVIVKPVDRSGSRGISKVSNVEDLSEAVKYAIGESFSKKAIIEEYIEGHEVSVETISWQGQHSILAITDKITTGAPHFVELAHHIPSQLQHDFLVRVKEETVKCLNALNINFGASHTELKITSDGNVFVIEVGARMGGDFIGSHLVELATGYDFLKGVIEVALNQFQAPVHTKNEFSGVYFLSRETEGLLPFFEKNNQFDFQKDIQSFDLKNITNSNERSGYLIYNFQERIELL